MHKFINATLMAASLYATSSGTAIAHDIAMQSHAVDARTVKVVLDGVISLTLKQGAVASLRISGERRYLSQVSVVQKGDTLRIGTDTRNGHIEGRGLTAELTLPNLRELVSAGVGAADISGFSGESMRIALDGAGYVTFASHYRNVDARLNGVGSMTVHAGELDNVDINLRGAGQLIVIGQSKTLRAQLGGIGSLDAQQLRADRVDADMSGLGGATFHARQAAHLRLSGLGSATVYGKPTSRSATSRGIGSVAWN